MTDAPNELAAFHEASHAVMRGYYFGHRIGEIWIDEERGNCRFCMPDHGDIGLLEDIAGSLAGKIAEDRLCGFKCEWKEGDGDYQRARDCAMRFNAGDKVGAELLLAWMSHRTELFVAKLWPQIQKVAYGLLQHERLSGEQINEILLTDGHSITRRTRT